MKLMIIAFLLIIFNTSFSQEELNYSILIESSSSSGQRYKTKIIRKPDLITFYDNEHLDYKLTYLKLEQKKQKPFCS